jgi:hypothetical protein
MLPNSAAGSDTHAHQQEQDTVRMTIESQERDTAVVSIPRGTRLRSREEFTQRLKQWYEGSTEPTLGDVGAYGRQPWVWVSVCGHELHLNADTTREGVKAYLDRVAEFGQGMDWHVRANNRGRSINQVCFDPDETPIPGFNLYVKQALTGTTSL